MTEATIQLIFFGTSDFAAHILQSLATDTRYHILGVVTQPDRPVGRHHTLTPPPVKRLAESLELPLVQPEQLKPIDPAFFFQEKFTNKPVVNIVAQYGRLIPTKILDYPTRGTINVHTSLLPKYRGASPVQSALLNGETETGVTIMLMDAGLDTGPILSQQTAEIMPDDTALSLEKKLAFIGAKLLVETIPHYLQGAVMPQSQKTEDASTCKKLDRDDGHIDWQAPATEIYNLYRGLYPWPGIWTMWQEQRLKLLLIKPVGLPGEPGKVFVNDKRLLVGCGQGSIEINTLQLEGKKAEDAVVFLNGHQNFSGQILV